jgi:hypothetical protein
MDLSQYPPEIRASIPAMQPPPGVTPNFVNPPSRAGSGYAVNAVFLPITIGLVTLRCYCRLRITRNWGIDDCMFFLPVSLFLFLSPHPVIVRVGKSHCSRFVNLTRGSIADFAILALVWLANFPFYLAMVSRDQFSKYGFLSLR